MKRTLLASLAATFGMGCPSAETTNQAVQWVDQGATLLDVRTAGEFASGHPDQAMNIPVGELAQRMSEIEADRVVVYCRSGVRSRRAAGLLRDAGKEVLDLGPMSAWPQ